MCLVLGMMMTMLTWKKLLGDLRSDTDGGLREVCSVGQAVPSLCVKRLRLLGRASQASTVPAEVFDLADDSDTDSVNSREAQLPPAPPPIDSLVVDEED